MFEKNIKPSKQRSLHTRVNGEKESQMISPECVITEVYRDGSTIGASKLSCGAILGSASLPFDTNRNEYDQHREFAEQHLPPGMITAIPIGHHRYCWISLDRRTNG